MDTYSATDVARRLGTSVPRVQRATTRLGLDARRGAGGRLRLTAGDVARLEAALGRTPKTPGLSRAQTVTLAALASAPLGVTSVRSLAARAHLSPTTVSRAVRRLIDAGLIIRERQTLALGEARDVEVLRADVTAPQWPSLAPTLASVIPPASGPVARRRRRVPRELRHLFWNTADAQLDAALHGGYIARRLLTAGDLDGLAWGATNLAAEDWRHAAAARGIPADRRALAINLAAYHEAAVDLDPQRRLEPTVEVGGIDVAGVGDIFAMKLKVIAERGELRDYFDLRAIEQQTGRRIEEGLQLFIARYELEAASHVLEPIVRALGYLDDVDEDALVPESKREIAAYWARRQPEIVRSLARTAY